MLLSFVTRNIQELQGRSKISGGYHDKLAPTFMVTVTAVFLAFGFWKIQTQPKPGRVIDRF